MKTAHALRVSAASHARSSVNALDLLAVLPDTFWVNPDERGIIRAWLWENLVPDAEEGAARMVLRSLLTRTVEALRATAGEVDSSPALRFLEILVCPLLPPTRLQSFGDRAEEGAARMVP